MGFLFGSQGSAETKVQYPGFVTQAGQKAVGKATQIANQKYQPYKGPRVASLTPEQQQASTLARTGAGTGQGMIQSGFDLAKDTGGREWNASTAEQYMNPYLGTVIKGINEQAAQDAIGARAGVINQGGVGAFGDARTGVLEGQLEEGRLNAVGSALGAGYESARAGFEAENDRRLRSADLQGTQGGRYGAVTQGDIGNLLQTGATGQATTQRSYDTAYQDFLEQRDWAQRGLDAYVRALSGVPFEQTTKSPEASPLQQLAGAGIAGAGLYSMFFG